MVAPIKPHRYRGTIRGPRVYSARRVLLGAVLGFVLGATLATYVWALTHEWWYR